MKTTLLMIVVLVLTATAGNGQTKGKPSEKDVAGTAAQQGDIRVLLELAEIDFVELKALGGGKGKSKRKLLQIRLIIQNLGDAKKIDYRGWAGNVIDFGDRAATLQDEFENSYRGVEFGFGNKIIGQVDSESIYPGKLIRDVLVFEEPVAKASVLTLKLPAKAFGGTGVLQIKVLNPLHAEKRAEEAARRADEEAVAREAAIEAAKTPKQKKAEAEKIEAARLATAHAQNNAKRERVEKAAQGRLRLAKQFLDANKTETALKWLRDVVKDYPKTDAAKEAQELLKKHK